jgi:hypothetical protein
MKQAPVGHREGALDVLMWWERGVVYEIYPRSFQDTDGDGVGDLRGVADRLPYLARLGVDAIWLTPFFASPMRDFGYDISDHCAIDPSFGTMEDFDALVAAAHGHGIKVVLDFVPNHTSDLHPWFEESRSLAREPEARLVPVARRRPAQQLDLRLRRPRVGVGRGDGPELLPRLPARAARPRLAQPGGARGDARGAALLEAARGRRLPGRRDAAGAQGPLRCATTRRPPAGRGRPTSTARWSPSSRPTSTRCRRSSPRSARRSATSTCSWPR